MDNQRSSTRAMRSTETWIPQLKYLVGQPAGRGLGAGRETRRRGTEIHNEAAEVNGGGVFLIDSDNTDHY